MDNLLGYALVTDMTDPWNTTEYLYVTINGGFSWNPPRYTWIDGAQKCALSVIPNTNTVLVGGIFDFGNSCGILKSTDGGVSWNTALQTTPHIVMAIQTPDLQHGWATGGYIYRYDYVPPATITRQITLNQGWNMISMPVDAPIKRADMLFPNMMGTMWGFDTQYFTATEMILGHGYWEKNSVAETINVTGAEIDLQSVTFATGGWHLLGSISTKICRSCLHTDPPNSIVGTIFAYNLLYTPTDTLYPGEGCWVKLSQPAVLYIDRYYTGQLMPVSPELIQQQIAELPNPPDGITEVPLEPLPVEFALEQNYPNPFNPVTTISYRVPSTSFIQLIVYDVTGQEVATLVAEELPPGSYNAVFNGAILPSGIYFYQLRAGEFIKSKKMVLLK